MEKKLHEIGLELGFTVIGGFAFLVAAWIISIWIERLARRWLTRHFSIEQTNVNFVARGCRIAFVTLSVIALLDALGTDIASLLAALGIFGFAIAIGLRSSLTNIFTGVFIHFLKPYKVGEYIAGERVEGIVEHVSFFHTELVTPGGVLVAVPNAALWSARSVKNFSRIRDKRITLEITVDRSKPFSELSDLMTRRIEDDPAVNMERGVLIRIDEVTRDDLSMRVSFWCGPEQVWDVGDRIKKLLRQELKTLGIPAPKVVLAAKTTAAKTTAAKRPARKPAKAESEAGSSAAASSAASGTGTPT